MKILWLSAGLLLPLDKGGKLRTWHLMRHLAARHEITYLSFVERGQTAADRAGMREVCAHLDTVPRTDPAKGTLRFYAEAASYLATPRPYAVGQVPVRRVPRRSVRECLERGGFDVIVADFLPPVANLPATLPCPAVLFTHNVEAEIWRRHAETAGNPLSRLLLGDQQWRRMLRFERGALARFDLVLAVSEADGRTFERLYPGALRTPVHVVRTGVDTRYFTPQPGARRNHLVFTGSMDWLPNEDGMLFFASEILPRIRRSHPASTLSIMGRAPTPAVQRLAQGPASK